MLNNGRIDSVETDLKKIISQKRRHLQKLQEQQAAFGLHTPPYVLLQIEDLEAEIEDLQEELETPSGQQNGHWQALVIDADQHWQEIIATEIKTLGGTAIFCKVIPTQEHLEVINKCAVAIVGTITATGSSSATDWLNRMIELGQQLPIVLVTGWDDRDMAISLRHTLRNDDNDATITTIFKENFDAYWFSQVIRHILLTH